MRYIDTHAHLGPWFEAGTTLTPDDLVARQVRAGIERTVVTSSTAIFTDLVRGNEWTFEQAETRDHLLVWLVLNPLRMQDSLDLLERYKEHPKLVGVKIHPNFHRYPADVRATYRLFAKIEPLGLAVLSHAENESYSSPDRLRRLAEAFPGITLVAAHFGVGQPGQTEVAIDHISECRTANLVTDMATARALRSGIIEQMVKGIGAEKILFGTDMPLYEARAFPALLAAADISNDERELIAYRNAQRLILEPRGIRPT